MRTVYGIVFVILGLDHTHFNLMLKAEYKDRSLAVEILVNSFGDNQSVNYIIKQDNKRKKRMTILMEYSFDICYLFGEVYFTDDKSACALVVLPEKKKSTFKSILLDAKLAVYCMGLGNVTKAMDREARIKSVHPEGLIYYLWFIGVAPEEQNKGIGSKLLSDVINEGLSQGRIICLETSTLINLPWYKKFGFIIYNTLEFGYKLFCLKKEL